AVDAMPLQRYTRPPEAGMTSLGIAFIAAVTDLAVTSPCRVFVPTVSAVTLWKSTTPFWSLGSTVGAYFLRMSAYWRMELSVLSPNGASAPNFIPLSTLVGTDFGRSLVMQNEMVVIVPWKPTACRALNAATQKGPAPTTDTTPLGFDCSICCAWGVISVAPSATGTTFSAIPACLKRPAALL